MPDRQNHCANPNCTARLNCYAFSPNTRNDARLFCTSSCYNAFRREERWTRRIMSVFSINEPLPGLFPEDK
jgi:hypothetical protein